MNLLNKLPYSTKTGWPWDKETPTDIYFEKAVWPQISIVTPSFNQGKYIEETLRSVLLQNYPNIEYIIIDGGSTDETVDILGKYSSFLTHWSSEKDRGQSHAINKGLVLCNGKIFNWINSDDFLEPYALYNIAKSFTNENTLAVISKVNVLDDNKVVRIRPTSFIGKSIEESVGNYNINQEGTYFSLSHLKQIGPINETFQFAMDCELWISLLLKFGIESIVRTDEIVSNYRRHAEAKSSIESLKNVQESQMFQDIHSIFKAISKFSTNIKINKALELLNKDNDNYVLRDNIVITNNLAKNIINNYLYKNFIFFYQSGDYKIAKKISRGIERGLLEKLQLKDYRYMKRQILFQSLGFKSVNL